MGHNSRDSTAINICEKPLKKEKIEQTLKKRGRSRKGEDKYKRTTRIKKQAAGMGLSGMLDDLPKASDVGTKKNSKDYKTCWTGISFILILRMGIPISCVGSASTQ